MMLGEQFKDVLRKLIEVQGLENTLDSLELAVDGEGYETISELVRDLEDELSYCLDSAEVEEE